MCIRLQLILLLTLRIHVFASDCAEHWIDCGNGRCIATIWKCDGDNDCGNLKDEEDCDLPPVLKCLSSQFPCVEDHHCIPNTWYCDGEHDCKDGSDERNCDNSTENCGFRCHNGHCVPTRWLCDGEKDCEDGSDEETCHSDQALPCSPSEFTCTSGTCLNMSLVCNGNKDCPLGEDEGNHCADTCDNSTCHQMCRSTPVGAECYCNPGYQLQKDGKSCADINECSEDGFCSHKCINKNGSFTCVCLEGYTLVNRTCLAKGPNPLLVFATAQEIRGIVLRTGGTERYFPIHSSVSRATAMDVDPIDSKLYWTDLYTAGSAVYSVGIDGSQFQPIINNGLLVPEDIGVDWLGKNLYITDSGLKQILVCKIDGSVCSVLHDVVDKPRSIALDPPEGLMYWSDWGRNPGIFRSGMDGTRLRPLVSKDIKWPNGIALDHTTNRLYWCDAQMYRIEYITLDGKSRKVILQESEFHPYSLAVFEDTLYWTDWTKFSIDTCNKFTGHQQRLLTRENGKHIMGIHVYHPVLEHSGATNPCWSTICSHLCVLSPFGKQRCLCPPGLYLASDKVTCKINPKAGQMFVSDKKSLFHVQPEAAGNKAVTEIPVKSVELIADIAYDQMGRTLFLTDISKNKILALNMTSLETREIVKSHLHSAEGLDYDCIGNNLYWTDFDKGTVEVLSLSKSERTILLKGLNKPLALVLRPEKGLMFLSVIGNTNPHIAMYDMDGTNRRELVSSTSLPMALALDPVETRIYWADPKAEKIYSVDYTKPKTSRKIHKYDVQHVISVAVSNKFLYWMTTKSDRLYRIEKNGEGQIIHSISIQNSNTTSIRKVKYVRAFLEAKDSSCSLNNGGCSHLCLRNPSGHTCACPKGLHIAEDSKTCKSEEQCSSTEVPCAKGSLCIPISWMCDGSHDCSDGSDEQNCTAAVKCGENEFQCKNGRCISLMWKCDYSDDCSDGSDELACPKRPPCARNEFDCENGQCVPVLWRCDGEKDCSNNKDEEVCHLTVCEDDKLRCDHGQCIPRTWVCDGGADCLDGTDEKDCPSASHNCTENQFTCNNGMCVDKLVVCDHRDDCEDNSDEQNCVYNNTCKAGMFSCGDGLCIYDHEVCDGRKDCDNGEDELNCNKTECGESFYCSSSMRCIPRKWLCDGDDDCGDAADEKLSACDRRYTSTHAAVEDSKCEDFTCNSGDCLPWSQICNGIPDCEDYSDEGNLCSSSCVNGNGGCSHLCVPTPGGPKCSCLEGFKLTNDGITCEDVDECQLFGMCSQFCNNTKGSFKCSCAEGYFMTHDHKNCKADGGPATIMYLLPNQIRGIELSSHSQNVFISGEWNDIRGMDFDARNGTFFWSEWRERVIGRFTPGTNRNNIIIRERLRPYFVKWDWIAENIYYTSGKALVKVCSNEGEYCATIVDTGKPHLNSFEIAPRSGYLFWSVWSTVLKLSSGIIERSNMDGSGRIEMVTEKVHWPVSLAVDHVMNHLYWADVKLNVIESADFHGLNRRIIIEKGVQYPYSIALFEDFVFWADWGSDSIMFCNKHTGKDSSQLHKGDVKAEGLMVVHKVQQQKSGSPCLNKCPQICLLKPNGYSCVCGNGFVANDSDCSPAPTTTMKPTPPPEKCSDGACLNGAGCVVVGGKIYCRCKDPYTGERCQDIDVKSGSTTDHSWVLALLFALFLIAGGLMLIYVCRRNRERISKLTQNVAVSFRNPTFPLRKSGKLVMDTDDPCCDELMLGQKGSYKASSGFGNPLFGQQEHPNSKSDPSTGEFKRWSSYDSEDSAFASEYQTKEGSSILNIDQEAAGDYAPMKGDKMLQFFRKL